MFNKFVKIISLVLSVMNVYKRYLCLFWCFITIHLIGCVISLLFYFIFVSCFATHIVECAGIVALLPFISSVEGVVLAIPLGRSSPSPSCSVVAPVGR